MKRQLIENRRIQEQYIRVEHPSGLTILLCPMPGYSSAYALFGTKYGSIDTTFKTGTDDDFVTVPEGIAHFLEHKLFEDENGEDAFKLYAQTGASANAFTSFDRTCYLFSCTDHFERSLEILLDFVQSPYFSDKSVAKEQGIIGQEIKMYQDNPGWRVMFNMLGCMYEKNPVKIDIAGTVESIARIDKDLLYRCYRTFYNLHNMVLAVTGNFDVDTVLRVADKVLKKAEPIQIETKIPEEPDSVFRKEFVQQLSVGVPMFHIGFKEKACEGMDMVRASVETDILLEILAGETSPLYRRMYDSGLINTTFETESFTGRGFFGSIFGGESRNPRGVLAQLLEEIQRLKQEGIAREDFDRSRKAIYGRRLRAFNDIEEVASMLVYAQFAGVDLYAAIDYAAQVSYEAIQQRFLKQFDPQHAVLSIIEPAE